MIRMLKILVIILLSSLAVNGQIFTRPNNSYGQIWNRGRFDSTLFFATYCGVPSGTMGLHSRNEKMSAIYYDSCGHRGYIFDPSDSSWTKIGATQLNDSTFIVGRDTITISGTGGGGGITALNNVGAGYPWATTPNGSIKSVVPGDGQKIDSTSTTLTIRRDTTGSNGTVTRSELKDTASSIRAAIGGGGGTPGGTNGQIQFNNAGSFAGGPSFTNNTLFPDSVTSTQLYTEWLSLRVRAVLDSLRFMGDSFTAAVGDSTYHTRLSDALVVPEYVHAQSGTGISTACSKHHLNLTPMHNGLTSVLVGFNDLGSRNIFGTNGRLTINKILEGFKSIICSHFLKSFAGAGSASGSITRYGSWTANWDARPDGGLSSQGAFTVTTNDSVVYTGTDSVFAVGLIGQYTTAQAGSNYSVYVDGSLYTTGSTDNKADGAEDGLGNNGNRIPVAVFITGLTYGAHSIKVVNNGSGVFIVDYIGQLRPAETAPPMLMFEIPYMKAAGYAAGGNTSGIAQTDAMNAILDSLHTALPLSYKNMVKLIETNNYYDTTTGTGPDNIHPNDRGQGQLYEGAIAALISGGVPANSIFAANNVPYYSDAGKVNKKIVLGEGSANRYAKFGSVSNEVVESITQDNGTNIGINQTPGVYRLGVTGGMHITGSVALATSSTDTLVGIGTMAPGYKLDVRGHTGIEGSVFSLGNNSGYNLSSRTSGLTVWGIYADNAATKFYDPSAAKDRIKFWHRGGITIANATEVTPVDQGVTLDIHGTVRIEKDSMQLVSATGTKQMLVYDTVSKKIERADVPARTLKGTTTWDPTSIGANSSTTTTITVTGAALGDPVTVSKTSGSYSNGEIYYAYVSAPNTVTLQLHNGSGGSFDITSADFNVIVLKY